MLLTTRSEGVAPVGERPEPLFEGDNGPDPDDVSGDPGEFDEDAVADPEREDEGLHELNFN